MLIYVSLIFLIILLVIINKPKKDIQSNPNINKLFEKITSNKKYELTSIKKKCFYSKTTIPLQIRLEVDYIIKLILEQINTKYKSRYYLIFIDNVDVREDYLGNKQYSVNFLANNNINYSGIRIKLDVIVYVKKSLSKLVSNINIGIPSNDQLIPLPHEVLVQERGIISTENVNPVKPDEFSSLYLNSIKILNSNLIIKEDKVLNDDNLKGVINTNNEYSYVKCSRANPYIEPSCIRNKWPTLYNEPKDRKQYPCQVPPNTWNELGVPSEKIIYTNYCPGKRESTEQTELQGQTYPTLGPLPRGKGDNVWLFERSRGIPSFPTGTS